MIIDNVDRLELTDAKVDQYANELRSLGYLAKGLEFLYDQVQKLEAEVLENLDKDKYVLAYGNAPQLGTVPQDLVACAFHWYAVTVCNYVRMVGWLAHGGNPGEVTNYLKSAIPEVRVWRDKVGAHFARVSPRSEDKPADLAASVMFPISFDGDAFYAASLRLIMSQSGKASSSRQDMRWSLTHTHRDLIPRYWPQHPHRAAQDSAG